MSAPSLSSARLKTLKEASLAARLLTTPVGKFYGDYPPHRTSSLSAASMKELVETGHIESTEEKDERGWQVLRLTVKGHRVLKSASS